VKHKLTSFVIVTVAATTLWAQQLDSSGNPMDGAGIGTPPEAADGRALGDVLNSFSDLGCWSVTFRGDELWGVSGDTMQQINPDTGALIGSLTVTPVLNGNGFGYDASRGVFLVADAGADFVSLVNETTGAVTTSFPAPGSGPVGIAHDTLRDGYWVVDFPSISLDRIDPTTGAVVGSCPSLPAGVSNPAGVAYAANNDRLIINSRGNGTTYILEAGDCSLVQSFPTPGGYGNGLAIRPSDLTIYLRDFANSLIQVVDSGGMLPVELTTIEVE
jgi:DNA-binding beta-propeller fold protein YncE